MKVPLQSQQKPFDHFEILVLVISEAKLRASTTISFITRTLDSLGWLGSGPYAIIANFPTFLIGLSLQLKLSDFSAEIDFISI